MSRFDSISWDDKAFDDQLLLKVYYQGIEQCVLSTTLPGRAQALALTALEESYMWCGKAIRDAQIERGGSAPLMEERKDE